MRPEGGSKSRGTRTARAAGGILVACFCPCRGLGCPGRFLKNRRHAAYFVDPHGIKPRINIQEKLKEAIRHNNGRQKAIDVGEFSIYLKKPPYVNASFLKYIPDHNGKNATKESVIAVSGFSFPRSLTTTYGTLWYQMTKLSVERLAEVLEARDAQRENRRHSGDSPSAT